MKTLTKYEDNFGFYCFDDDDNPEELELFCHIRAQSEPTICARCSQKVRLLKHIKICATCSQALEYGAPSTAEGYKLSHDRASAGACSHNA
jgi:hypothetical protein